MTAAILEFHNSAHVDVTLNEIVIFLLGHCNMRKQWILEVSRSAILALMAGHFVIKLIPEFNGSGSLIEWMEKTQMVCDLCGLKQVEWHVPL